jgi:hypothetical protein
MARPFSTIVSDVLGAPPLNRSRGDSQSLASLLQTRSGLLGLVDLRQDQLSESSLVSSASPPKISRIFF